jgi:hypothetical protein
MTTALSTLSTFKGDSLSYATSAGGSFTALTGFIIQQEPVPEPDFNDGNHTPMQTRRAICKGPITPAFAIGYQIKDSTQSPALTWAVEGVLFESQQIATLSRKERVLSAGPDRGASA